jgi:hypothetical protein
MTIQGYIPIPRELFADGHWAEEREYTKAEALIYLYARAAYAPHRRPVDGKLIELQPGQLVASLRYLGEAWGWSKNKVANFLTTLENGDTLRTEIRTGITVITISFLSNYYTEAQNQGTPKGQQTGHQRDSEGTAKGQQRDKEEESNKETKKEGKVRATPAPPSFNPSILQSSNPSIPGDPAFDLLKRIGKPAAQLWVQGNAADHFDSPAHADIALDWMAHLCRKHRPLASQQELSALIKQFKGHSPEALGTVTEYSYTKGYTALFFDQLQKTKKTNTHKPEIIQKDRFTKERQQAQSNGLIKFD